MRYSQPNTAKDFLGVAGTDFMTLERLGDGRHGLMSKPRDGFGTG